MATPVIYRGDDTGFNGAAPVVVNVKADFDLDGCTATLELGGRAWRLEGLSGREASFSLSWTAAETAAMAVGTHRATVRIADAEGRVRTVSDSVRIRVTDDLAEAYGGADAQEVDVEVASGGAEPLKGETVETGTVSKMREAVKRIAEALGATATAVALCAAPFGARGAEVAKASLGDLDLDANPAVVTNVTFDGLATADALNAVSNSLSSDVSSALASANAHADAATNALADYAAKKYLPLAGGVIQSEDDDVAISMTNGTTTWGSALSPNYLQTKISPGEISMKCRPLGASFEFSTIGPYTFNGIMFGGDEEELYLPFPSVRPYANNRNWIGKGWATNILVTTGMLGDSTNALAAAMADAGRVKSVNNKTGEVTIVASDIGAATEDAVAEVSQSVGEVWTYLKGDNFRVVVTNYDSAVNPARTRYDYRMGTNEAWRTVWTETNGLAWAVSEATNLAAGAAQTMLDKPENRAWGGWDSHTGLPAPDGVVQVSGGGGLLIGSESGWTQINATGGSYWVLTSTDPTLRANGTNGVFQITDPDGKSVMTIKKGDKRLVYADAAGITKSGDTITVKYEVISDKAPTAEVALALDGTWYEQGASGAPFAVSWSGSSGAWVMTATAPSGGTFPTTGFFRAMYETGGDTEVVYDAAIGLTKVRINNVQYTVTVEKIDGKNHLILTEAN